MALLNYLPEIAKKFGLNGNTAVLKPKTEMPEIKHDDHVHERVNEILQKNKHLEVSENDDEDDDDDDDDEESIFVTSHPVKKLMVRKVLSSRRIAEKTPKPTNEIVREEKSQYNSPYTKSLGKMTASKEEDIKSETDDVEDDDNLMIDPAPTPKNHRRSPMVINIILGLCCGILVVMLIVVIVMVVQRRRVAHTRVVIAENNDDREHLIQMQKNGFENPTYKFFYY